MTELEKISLDFSKYQQEYSELLASRQQLETQFQENSIVLKEFEGLESDAKVYKLTGPVLLPQDQSEAKSNVEKRILFIKNEIERVEENVKTTQNKLESARNMLIQLRTANSQ